MEELLQQKSNHKLPLYLWDSAQGYSRGLSNKGSVLIRGKRILLEKVCMDQFMVDVTEIPEAEELDEVTLGKEWYISALLWRN